MCLASLALAFPFVAHAQDELQRHTERMAREHASDAPVANPLSSAAPATPVRSEEVVYGTVDGAAVTGYVVRPADVGGPLPGVIVIHEWWGLNDNVRSMAGRLAAEGFEVLAVDLYGGRSASTPDEARALMERVSERPEPARDNLRQAAAWFRDRGVPSIGSLGWCFGGGWSLQTAVDLGDELDGAVVYYGFVETDPEALRSLTAPVLAFFGGQDRGIPLDRVRAFEAALEALAKDAEVIVYPEAGHAFANPSGRNWEPAAADDSWQRAVAFLHEVLADR
jgi:carboxymethylenebutenolidase